MQVWIDEVLPHYSPTQGGSPTAVGEIPSGAELRAVHQAINFVWKEKWPGVQIFTDSLAVANVSADCRGPRVQGTGKHKRGVWRRVGAYG